VAELVSPVATEIANAESFHFVRLEVNGVAIEVPVKELKRRVFAQGSVAYEYRSPRTGLNGFGSTSTKTKVASVTPELRGARNKPAGTPSSR
jgi:hypothetical protein